MKKLYKTWSTPVTEEEKQLIPCTICGGLSFKPSLPCKGFYYVYCAKCGLVQMNPQPVEREINQRYCSRGGNDYLAYELANEEAFLNLQLLALEDAGFNKIEKDIFSANQSKPAENTGQDKLSGAKILDIGCAIGSLLSKLRDRGWETTGVEISAPQAEYGQRERGLDIRTLPLTENNFQSGSFDVVLASHIIEHLNDPGALVREVHRILKKGGSFFVTTPNIASFQARLFGGYWRSAIFDHLYLFSASTLSRLLSENGFMVEKKVSWGGIAAGLVPVPIKRFFDKAAKYLDIGDVMIMRVKSR